MNTNRTLRAADLRCGTCGQLPEAPRLRVALAGIATVFPIELLAHIVVLNTDLPDAAKVLVLATTATVLVLWVAEPSVRRFLRSWLHAAAVRHRRSLDDSPALWRVRVAIPHGPGSLKRITRGFARLNANILTVHVHRSPLGALDDLVVAAPDSVTDADLIDVLYASGGREVRVTPTTPILVTDAQTQALNLAARVVSDPSELASVVADFLSADIVDSPHAQPRSYRRDPTVLKLPNVRHGPLMFSRPGQPFTPAESGRAHRLAELAEIIELTQLGAAPHPLH